MEGFEGLFFLKKLWMFAGKRGVLLDKNETWWWNEEVATLVKEKQRFIQAMEKGPRSARKDVDVRRQEGKSCVGVGERLEVRGAVWT